MGKTRTAGTLKQNQPNHDLTQTSTEDNVPTKTKRDQDNIFTGTGDKQVKTVKKRKYSLFNADLNRQRRSKVLKFSISFVIEELSCRWFR